jgi:hypothetical protein
MATGLTAAAIVVILFAANFTITNAQQTSQPAAIQNGTLFQNAEDGFRVQVPQGWIIHDMENTGFTLLSEVLQGYGILAQLCSEEQQQALRNVGGGSTLSSCEGSEGDVIYIVRYPNLGTRLGLASGGITTITNDTIDDILSYQIQKLQEVGYRDIQILNSTDTTVNIDISTEAGISNNNDNTVPAATVPAKLVEITYSTNFAPNEIRTGHFILTATDGTPRNLGEITGYSIFYEGATAATAEEETTTASGSLPSPTAAAAVRQVFDSFELITAAAEVTQATAEAQAEQTEQTNQPNSERTNDDDDDGSADDGDDENSDGGTSNCEGEVHGRAASGPCDDYDETADDEQSSGDNNDDTARTQGSAASGVNNDYDETADDEQSPGDCESC